MARFVEDDTVTLTNTFTVAGTATDPTAATLTVTAPDGTTSTPSLTNSSTGVYTANVTANQAGVWHYRWVGTGAAADVEEGTFTVIAEGPDRTLYASLDEFKAWVSDTLTADDLPLIFALTAASRAVDQYCNRRFVKATTATARTFYPYSSRSVRVDDFHTTTDLVVKTDTSDNGTFDTTWDSSDFQLEPTLALAQGRAWPYTHIRAVESKQFPTSGLRTPVEVTAQWGWPSVPEEVRLATLIEAHRLHRRRQSPEGVAGFGEFGIAVRIRPDSGRLLTTFRVDPVTV